MLSRPGSGLVTRDIGDGVDDHRERSNALRPPLNLPETPPKLGRQPPRKGTKRETLQDIARRVPVPIIREYFNFSLRDAAHAMSISVTSLKRLCRRHGVKRWPHRQLNGLNRAVSHLEVQHRTSSDPAITEQLRQLYARRDMVINDAFIGDDDSFEQVSNSPSGSNPGERDKPADADPMDSDPTHEVPEQDEPSTRPPLTENSATMIPQRELVAHPWNLVQPQQQQPQRQYPQQHPRQQCPQYPSQLPPPPLPQQQQQQPLRHQHQHRQHHHQPHQQPQQQHHHHHQPHQQRQQQQQQRRRRHGPQDSPPPQRSSDHSPDFQAGLRHRAGSGRPTRSPPESIRAAPTSRLQAQTPSRSSKGVGTTTLIRPPSLSSCPTRVLPPPPQYPGRNTDTHTRAITVTTRNALNLGSFESREASGYSTRRGAAAGGKFAPSSAIPAALLEGPTDFGATDRYPYRSFIGGLGGEEAGGGGGGGGGARGRATGEEECWRGYAESERLPSIAKLVEASTFLGEAGEGGWNFSGQSDAHFSRARGRAGAV